MSQIAVGGRWTHVLARWTHGDWIQLAVAVGTLLLAGVTIRLASITRRVLVESNHARIDARAPRVVLLNPHCSWPPLQPSIGAGDPQPLLPGTELGEAQVLLIRSQCRLRNEGLSTAFLKLRGSGHAVSLSYGIDLGDEGPPLVVDRVPNEDHDLLPLEPGSEALVLFGAGRPVAEWGMAWRGGRGPDTQPLTLTIVAADQFAEGVTDTIVLEVHAFPVDDTSKTKGTWAVRAIPDSQVREPGVRPVWTSLRPTIRSYKPRSRRRARRRT